MYPLCIAFYFHLDKSVMLLLLLSVDSKNQHLVIPIFYEVRDVARLTEGLGAKG